MKQLDKLFEIARVTSHEEYFSKLSKTFKNNITTWDYFVDWTKAISNVNQIELELNILNYLIGKPEEVIKDELRKLLTKYPKVAQIIPVLVAFREQRTQLLTYYDSKEFIYKQFDFSSKDSLNDDDIENIVEFADKSGFLKLIIERKIKNIVDYVIGVEVGLDSNARKNRTGKLMENIVEIFIKDICTKYNLEYLKQANSKKIMKNWGIKVTVDKSARLIDFAVKTKTKLFLIETNFYSGGGSKLKSTAGEYKTMFDFWKNDGHQFIWITDGHGWKSSLKPLRETFGHIDYILNLQFVADGMLETIFNEDI